MRSVVVDCDRCPVGPGAACLGCVVPQLVTEPERRQLLQIAERAVIGPNPASGEPVDQ